jgi:hypothetical protein
VQSRKNSASPALRSAADRSAGTSEGAALIFHPGASAPARPAQPSASRQTRSSYSLACAGLRSWAFRVSSVEKRIRLRDRKEKEGIAARAPNDHFVSPRPCGETPRS